MTEKYKPKKQFYIWTDDTHTQNFIVEGLVRKGIAVNPADPFKMELTKKGELPMIPVPYYVARFAVKSREDSHLILRVYLKIGDRLAGEFKLGEIGRLARTKKVRDIKLKMEKLKRENIELKKKLAEKSA